MKKFLFIFTVLLICISVHTPLFAQSEDARPAWIGSWMLDRVYENASGENPFILQPESAAAVYGEATNIYSFYPDGTAEMAINEGGEILVQRGKWTQNAGIITMTMDDPAFEMDLFPAPDGKTLHRYYKELRTDSDYHDLDFVYTKAPAGIWKMTQVFSAESGQEPAALDPESAGSLYSENRNVYYLFTDGKASVLITEGGETAATEEGTWRKEGDHYILNDGMLDMELVYDTEENKLHRYWTIDMPEAAYQDLDFVYFPAPVGSWRLVKVFNEVPGEDRDELTPENAGSLYSESADVYYFFADGTASVSLPEGAGESGYWTQYADHILLTLGDDYEMRFEYDAADEALHRRWEDDDPEAAYKKLDFVYKPEQN